MASFITLNNETYSAKASTDERFANFSCSPKASGETMVIFKGLMSLVNPIGADPIKAAVKVYRNNNDKTNGVWDLRASTYIKSVAIGEVFAEDYKSITFPKCFRSTIETVSTFNKQFKMSNGQHRKLRKNELTIFENYIDGCFRTFINDDGTIEEECPEILEAFCHYSYHESHGKMIITGLKGAWKNDKFQLTAPRIHTKGGTLGPDDRGQEAVFKFFLGHACNSRCGANWRHPLSSPPALDLGRITNMMLNNQNAGSATPPPSYKSVIQLVCGNHCHRFRLGDNSVVVLPEHCRQQSMTGSDAVSSLQCG
ncbi:alpha-protein kinase 1-like isoform X2 [Argopecten irradians]